MPTHNEVRGATLVDGRHLTWTLSTETDGSGIEITRRNVRGRINGEAIDNSELDYQLVHLGPGYVDGGVRSTAEDGPAASAD